MAGPTNKKILLARPRGFCGGVNRALDIADYALKLYPPPIYVRHELVHNKHVVNSLKNQGIVFVEDLDSLTPGSTLIFSAHGVSFQIHEQAQKLGLNIIDATCPLVTSVHRQAAQCAREGYAILLIGHQKHVEIQGTLGHAPEHIYIIQNESDAHNVQPEVSDKICYLTQTTLSLLDTQGIVNILKKRFPHLKPPSRSNICYATTDRQLIAQKVARQCEAMLIIGSQNSSNSNRLKEIAQGEDTPAYLIDDASEIQKEWLQSVTTVGVTAGASAPEYLVEQLLNSLQDLGFTHIETRQGAQENISFALPKKIKDMLCQKGQPISIQSHGQLP